jgi:hypothetical protein
MIKETNWVQKLAEDRASEALEAARKTLERALQEVATYQVKLAEAQTPDQKADIINWTINYLATGIYPNLRIDQLASAQADLKAQSLEAKQHP